MKYLIDTHVLIWFLNDTPSLPTTVLKELQNPANEIFFSQISLFEIAIKQKIGKLPELTATISDIYLQALKDNFSFLALHNTHIVAYNRIPLYPDHRDPFDRLLLASALVEGLPLITGDGNFGAYKDLVQVIW